MGTRYYIINKPKKEASKLYFNVPASMAVSTRVKYPRWSRRMHR